MRFVEKTRRNPVYTDFEDELGEAIEVELPGVTPGHELRTLPRQGRGLPQASTRTTRPAAAAPQQAAHARRPRPRWSRCSSTAGGAAGRHRLGHRAGRRARALHPLARRSRPRTPPSRRSRDYLDGTRFTADQIRFVNLIVDELTANGVMEPGRLFESPYTDHAPTGPDFFFPDADVDVIVDILHDVKQRALPIGAA